MAGYVAWSLAGWGGAALAPVRSLLVCFPPLLLAGFAVRRITAASDLDGHVLPAGARRAWGIFALGVGINGVASVCWGAWQVTHPNAATPRWVDLFTLLSSPVLLASYLTFPTVRTLRREGGRVILDCLLAVVPSLVAIWYLGVHVAGSGEPIVDRAIALGFPVGDLLMLFGIAITLLRVPHSLVRGSLRWLAISQVLAAAADFAYACRNSTGVYLSGGAIDVVWLLSWAADWIALSVQSDALADPDALTAPSGVDDSLLPAACVVLGYFEVAAVVHPRWPSDLAVVLAVAALSTVLLMLRQRAATGTNVRLLLAKRREEARYQHLFNHSPLPMWVYDTADGQILDVNAAAVRHYGYTRAEFLALGIRDLRPAEDVEHLATLLENASAGARGPFLVRHQLRDGRVRDVEVSSDAIDVDGRRARLVAASDVTERQATQNELARLAFHDALTELPNRALFHDRVRDALAAGADGRQHTAVLFLDLDDFKTINDGLGHAAGDTLLRVVADRLRSATRGSDTVARLGGDEFAILLPGITDVTVVDTVVERIQDALARSVSIEGRDVQSCGSLGIALAAPGDTVEVLLRNADAAMYAAKRGGKGAAARYQADMHSAAVDRLDLGVALRDALAGLEAAGRFEVHFQPIVQIATGRPTSAEALVRWHHPTRGTVSPAQFIPLAEETGLIVNLGTWVLREACRVASGWPLVDGQPPSVAVNLAARQLSDPGFVATVREALAETGLAPERLTLELTEGTLIRHMDVAIRVLGELRGLGVRVAVDDFGIGYSSLAYLQRFPLDILKIDKAFVDALGRGVRHEALARAVVVLAQTLGLRTVAEGVEREEQRHCLAAIGCDAAQGFLFARPLPADALAAMWEPIANGARHQQSAAPSRTTRRRAPARSASPAPR